MRSRLLLRLTNGLAAVNNERREPPASHAEMEGFFSQLADTLDAIDFHKGRAPESAMRKLRLPRPSAFGSWEQDPAWAHFYDWSVEHPRIGGAVWRLGLGSDLGELHRATDEIGRQPAGSRILDIPCGGGVAPVAAVSSAALTSCGMSSHTERTGEVNWPDWEQK